MDSLSARECAKIIKKFKIHKKLSTHKKDHDDDKTSKEKKSQYCGFASLINQELIFLYILDFLYLKDIARLDSAITNKVARPIWLKGLGLCNLDNDVYYSISTTNTIRWCVLRNIRFESIELCDAVDDIGLTYLSKISQQIGRIIIDNCLSITPQGLSILFKNCPFLESLEIICDEQMEEDLDEVELYDLKTENEKALIQLSKSCHTSLTDISLGYFFITASAFHQFVSSCTALESIETKDCFVPTDSYLRSIGAQCPSLQKIEMSTYSDYEQANDEEDGLVHEILNDSKISDEGVKAIANGCPLLQVMEIQLGSLVTDESIVILTQQCPLLESIDLENTSITNRSLNALGQLAHLSTITLNNCQRITNDGIESLVKYNSSRTYQNSSLTEIYIKNCLQLSSNAIIAIATHCPQLLKLELGNTSRLQSNQPIVEARIGKNTINYLLEKCGVYHLKFANLLEEKHFLNSNTSIKKELKRRLKEYTDSDPLDPEYEYTFY